MDGLSDPPADDAIRERLVGRYFGETSDEEARELTEEGIKVGRIPWIPRTDS